MKTRCNYFYRLATVFVFALALSGCATDGGINLDFYNNVEKTNQLVPGMSHKEVLSILGKPKSSQFIGDKAILKYSLHQEWKGFVPYYVVFDKKTAKLISWYADEAEYQQNQQMWMQVFETYEKAQQAEAKSAAQTGTSSDGTYMEGYDPNANYYTDDYYWSGSGYHYED